MSKAEQIYRNVLDAMQDEEVNEWNMEKYTEIEDEAFTRWKLFTFYLLDPDSEARLV